MITLSFILARLRLLAALLPLLTFRKIANLLLAVFHFLVRSERSVAHPSIMTLTLTTACNYSCIMCLRSANASSDKGSLIAYDKPREMDFDTVKTLLQEHAEYLCIVRLHGGEPLVYSKFSPLVKLLNELEIPYNIVTNGSLLDHHLSSELVGSYCFGISVSLDAAGPQTYASIRKGGDLTNVLAGIDRVVALKKTTGSPRPILSASMCTFVQNMNEMTGLVRLCSDHGIADLTITEGWDYDTPEIDKSHLIANRIDETAQAISRAKTAAKRHRINLRLRFPSLSRVNVPGVPSQAELNLPQNCMNLYASVWVLPEFQLVGCSNATAGFGNLKDTSFQDIWNGTENGYVRARRGFRDHSVPTECVECIYTGNFFS